MTTRTLPEEMLWGKRIITAEEVAVPFYNVLGWNALDDAQKWAEENNGRLESAHGTLETRIEEAKTIPDLRGPAWKTWITTNSEEDAGVDAEGRFGRKGELVGIMTQGGGIMLSSPKNLQAAYTNRTPKGEPSINQQHISRLLAGFLPNGQLIKVYTFSQLMREDPAKLPQIYAIVAPIQEFSETPSGLVAVKNLPKNKLFIARAGHLTTAENYAHALEKAGVLEYGNWHVLTNADANNPSGRVLHVGDSYDGGLIAIDDLGDDARFVGVRQGAEGAAPQKTAQVSPLEELAGKARDAGNGTLVINAKDISPAAYNALTGTK